jgi:hypothetical protein
VLLNENKELKIAPTRGPQVGQVLLNQAGPRGHPRKFRGRTQRPGPNFPGHNEGATRAAHPRRAGVGVRTEPSAGSEKPNPQATLQYNFVDSTDFHHHNATGGKWWNQH